MQIDLFTCTAENHRVDKTNYISNRFTMEGTLRNQSSVIDPIITCQKTNPAVYNYNYMYIGDFNRWYFINNIETIRNDIWNISAHVDVLFSWRASILNSLALIDRTENLGSANLYIDNGTFVTESKTYNTVQSFPNALNLDGEYILICAGGVGS